MNRYEYWNQRHTDAEIARDVAAAKRAAAVHIGQLTLLETVKPDIYKERHGEVKCPLPERDDLAA